MAVNGLILLIWITFPILISIFINVSYTKKFEKGFDQVKDLVRGTIIVQSIHEL